MSATNEHLAFEILARLPAGSHLARRKNDKWCVNIRPTSINSGWHRFVADTPYEAICDAANWYASYCRALDAQEKT